MDLIIIILISSSSSSSSSSIIIIIIMFIYLKFLIALRYVCYFHQYICQKWPLIDLNKIILFYSVLLFKFVS